MRLKNLNELVFESAYDAYLQFPDEFCTMCADELEEYKQDDAEFLADKTPDYVISSFIDNVLADGEDEIQFFYELAKELKKRSGYKAALYNVGFSAPEYEDDGVGKYYISFKQVVIENRNDLREILEVYCTEIGHEGWEDVIFETLK